MREVGAAAFAVHERDGVIELTGVERAAKGARQQRREHLLRAGIEAIGDGVAWNELAPRGRLAHRGDDEIFRGQQPIDGER